MELLFHSTFGPSTETKDPPVEDQEQQPEEQQIIGESPRLKRKLFGPDFWNMCHAKGIRINPHVTVRRSRSTGVGLYAVQAVNPHDTLINFAPGSYLSSVTFRATEAGQAVNQMLAAAGWTHTSEQLLWTLVAMERSKGSSSSWAPWLNLLPAQHTNLPRNWNTQALSKLRGTGVYEHLLEDWALAANFTTAVCPLLDQNPLFPASTCSQLAWAIDVVSSRAVTLQRELFLFPLYDFANHNSSHSVPHFSEELVSGSKEMGIRVDGATAEPGKQVFISYGFKIESGDLLRRWGFMPKRNPHERVHVHTDFLRLASNVGFRGLSHGEQHALSVFGSQFVLRKGAQPPRNFIAAIRVYSCKEQELTCSQDYTRPLQDLHELHIWSTAYAIFRKLWMRMSFLSCVKGDADPNIKTATAYRDSQSQVLRHAMKYSAKLVNQLAWKASLQQI